MPKQTLKQGEKLHQNNNFPDVDQFDKKRVQAKLKGTKEAEDTTRAMSRHIVIIDPIGQKEALIANWWHTNKASIDQGVRLFSSQNSQIIANNVIQGTTTFLLSNGQRWEVEFLPIGYFQANAPEPFWIWSFTASLLNHIPAFANRVRKFEKNLRKLGNVYGVLNAGTVLMGPTSNDVGANLEAILATCYYILGPIGQFTLIMTDQQSQQLGLPQSLWGMTEYNLVTKMWRV